MKEQIAPRWNQQVALKPSRGSASPRKMLSTVVFVTLVLALSLYTTFAARPSQIKVCGPVCHVWHPHSLPAELELYCCWTGHGHLGHMHLRNSVPCFFLSNQILKHESPVSRIHIDSCSCNGSGFLPGCHLLPSKCHQPKHGIPNTGSTYKFTHSHRTYHHRICDNCFHSGYSHAVSA